ncbi:RNA-binding protein Cwf29 [Mucor velutinosus]|uniref:RNA-binding protein Cwf29 n=1 Tax=Mucor velutinosus TaxID=708070 RepID=A0AAN7HR00_9FUNG|nr:RNA-binding protein Cwf29 [Mucor velutinosus]
MNILSVLLGHYNQDQEFNLYKIENTDTLLFKLNDITHLFNLESSLFEKTPQFVDKQKNTYINTTELVQIAIQHNKFLLAELCKLKPNDYVAKLDESMLANLPRLVYSKSKKDASQYQITSIELTNNSKPVKSEPLSPSPPQPRLPLPTHTSDPMALDHIITSNKQARRLSRTFEDPPPIKKQKKIEPLPKPLHTVSSQQPTLLAKRLGNNINNKRNLTIYAPTYGEQFNGIRSAPLNSNFRQAPATKPHPLSKATLVSPANSSTASEFAIPPIVPSQQQPPHTAHPSSIHRRHSPQYPASAFGHSFPVTSGRVEPPTKPSSLQRQQFMQPFEHLFDTIETTRNLKSTLDDQIRRSSTLIQTLQASSTTIEGLVRNQIKEAQMEIMHRMEDSIDGLFHRISSLERRLHSPAEDHHETRDVSPTSSASHGNNHSTTSLPGHPPPPPSAAPAAPSSHLTRQQQQDLVSPPTIVRSQHDIGPNEYHSMLDTLRERLDRLEKQLES